jgi:fumarylpyruvate hydrolase
MRHEASRIVAREEKFMSYVVPTWDIPSLPIAGRAERFPVRHIYCVGRNYAEHAKEMGGDAAREPPFFFTKPADAIVPIVAPEVGSVPYPLATKNYQYELELVAAIGTAGVKVAPERANELIYGYAVGLDMTRRDLQIDMREKKRPWDLGKSFAAAAPIGPVHAVSEVGHPQRGRISLDVNGETRQRGDLSDMIWDVPHVLHFLSQYYELLPGDLVFTGTPAGVGPVVAGDLLVGRIESLGQLSVRIAAP